ncbi:hypothetical protein [Lutibaculum baratangense]|uniref:Uncharacterized protein n=1 Tax=Lutibaculum baratangense AMV1 TaxID=631454 RepID=V4RJJ8_9HYPH|nr:hypothetical protein [Lutibaculum baratangense]ESR25499.1 hypothetical protein N177_1611 [Lutibaculum baratangense AMV1]
MDLFARLLMRAAMWVRHPPSTRTLITVFAAIAIALALAGIETFVGWPDWLTADRVRHPLGMR